MQFSDWRKLKLRGPGAKIFFGGPIFSKECWRAGGGIPKSVGERRGEGGKIFSGHLKKGSKKIFAD